jgi:hypothetical protein
MFSNVRAQHELVDEFKFTWGEILIIGLPAQRAWRRRWSGLSLEILPLPKNHAPSVQ